MMISIQWIELPLALLGALFLIAIIGIAIKASV
jgi:hypothetical protein